MPRLLSAPLRRVGRVLRSATGVVRSPAQDAGLELLGRYGAFIYFKAVRETKPLAKTFEVHLQGELVSIQRSREVAPLIFAVDITDAVGDVAVRFANEMPFIVNQPIMTIENLKETQPSFLKDINATHRARTRVLEIPHSGNEKVLRKSGSPAKSSQAVHVIPKAVLDDETTTVRLPDSLAMLEMRMRGFEIDPTSPIVICCCRNEEALLERFIPYYRNLGIKNFIFVDNDSTDESMEVYERLSEGDITVYWTDQIYNEARSGIDWSNSILEFFDGAIETWFLVLDADEYLVFPECETIPIAKFADDLWKKVKAEAILTPLIDLYPQGNLKNIADIPLDEVNCFDPDQYIIKRAANFPYFQIEGGPRRRVMDSRGFALKKVAMFRNVRGVRLKISTHALTERLELAPVTGALLHYKFSASWIEKVEREKVEKRRTQAKDYAKYGQAFENDIYFFDPEVSKIYTTSQDLIDAGLMWGGPNQTRSDHIKDPHLFASLIPLLSAANSHNPE